MNTRQRETLLLLLHETGRLRPVQELADHVGCSEKTLRGELKAIEELLNDYPGSHLVRRPGLGIMLEASEEDRAELFGRLSSAAESASGTADDERMLQIAYRLLMNPKPAAVSDFASRYYVPKSLIRRDLDRISDWLDKFGLKLESRQKVGLVLQGSEKDRRSALSRLSQLAGSPELMQTWLRGQFAPQEIETVQRELRELQKRFDVRFADETLESLLLHVLFVVKRTMLKQPISLSPQEIEALRGTSEYAWTVDLLQRIGSVLALHFPEPETAYLTLHLLGARMRDVHQNETRRELAKKNPILSGLVARLVERVCTSGRIEAREDEELLGGLSVHLYTTLNRLGYGLPVSNPMTEEIKKMYPYMFHLVISALEEAEETLGLRFPEEEAAYLTLHFQASLERLQHARSRPKRTVVVCHMGIGMSRLLLTRIESKFPSLEVAACLPKSDVEGFLAGETIDFVISTVDLPQLGIPLITVSPLLEPADEKKLAGFVRRMDEPIRNRAGSALLKYTTPFLVFLQQDVRHPYEAIERLASVLSDKGFVDPDYVHSAVSRERMTSTAIGSGIAIPHGSPKLIRQSAIAIAAFREPIDWGTEKVSLAFMLAVRDEEPEETRELFRELSALSEQPSLIQSMACETEAMKFLSLLNRI